MIITGIEMNKDEIYVLFKQYHSHQITSFKEQKINGNYHGTGDIFLSYMIGKYFISHEMNISIQEAMKFVKDAIVLTKEDTNHSYGIKFEKVLRGFYEKANQSKCITIKKSIMDKIWRYFFLTVTLICSSVIIFIVLFILIKGLTPFIKSYHINGAFYKVILLNLYLEVDGLKILIFMVSVLLLSIQFMLLLYHYLWLFQFQF